MPEKRSKLRCISWLLSSHLLSKSDSPNRRTRYSCLSLPFSSNRSTSRDIELSAPSSPPSSPLPPTEAELWAAAEEWVTKQVLVTFRHRAIISQLRPVYAGVKSIDPGDLMLQIILPPKMERCAPRYNSSLSSTDCCAATDNELPEMHLHAVDRRRAAEPLCTPHADTSVEHRCAAEQNGPQINDSGECKTAAFDRSHSNIDAGADLKQFAEQEMNSIEELKLLVRKRLAHFDAMQNITEPEVNVRRWNHATKIWAHRMPFRKLNGQEIDRTVFSQCSQPSDNVTL